MTGLLFILLIVCAVFLIVLWNKVSHLEKEVGTLRNQVHNSNFEKETAPQDSKDSAVNAGQTASQPVYPAYTHRAAESPTTPKYLPLKTSLPSAENANPNSHEKMESWLGRNVLGIAASVLIFIGLIFLGTLVYKYFTENMKILAMYAISTAITGMGIFLTMKKRNNFTEILAGCGCGSFFISILLTHIYFNRISDLAAFSLLLIWAAAVLYLSKILSSTLLSIVAHIGMVISICLAFGMSLTDSKLLLLLLYQAASIIVILVGNTLCCKKTFQLGVFVSLFLTVVASSCMWNRFTAGSNLPDDFTFATTLPKTVIVAAFAAQFLCASFLSYLLSVSANRLKNEFYKIVAHIFNKALWLLVLVINVFNVTFRIVAGFNTHSVIEMSAYNQLTATFAAVIVCLTIILLHAVLTLYLSLKLNFSSKLETYSVLILSAAASLFLLILWGAQSDAETSIPRLTFLIILSLLLLLARHISRNKAYAVGANVLLAVDLLFMLFDGYQNLTHFGTIACSFGYLILYLCIIMAQWLMQSEDVKSKYSDIVRLAILLTVEFSFISFMVTSQLKYRAAILLLLLTAFNTILYFFRYDRNTDRYSELNTVMLINQYMLLVFDAGFIGFVHKDATETVLYLALSAFAFGLSFIRIKEVFDGSDNTAAGILTGIKLTVLALATIYGETSWFDQAYCFSISCMLIALICIIFGFKGHVKSLRLYGLVMELICVFKLVTYDVSDLNTPLRVIALIGGGVICFIISAIYNYAAKKISNQSDAQI